MEATSRLASIPLAQTLPVVRSQCCADRIYRVAEILQRPLYFLCNGIIGRVKTVLTPGEFGNCNSKILEVIRRIFLVCISPVVAVVTLVSYSLSILINLCGDLSLGNTPYLFLSGNYLGSPTETFATFNMSTLLPPMTMIDGVEDSKKRLEGIAKELTGFNFVCGQEVDGNSARILAQELSSSFREFYTYIGKSNAPLISSGLFFATKETVLSVQVIPFTGDVQKTIKRCLVIFEFEKYLVAQMHLDGGSGEKVTAAHVAEIEQAAAVLKQYQKPVILCGDFNEDRTRPSKAYQTLTDTFVDVIGQEAAPVMTCTDLLKIERFGMKTPPTEESIDYLMYPRNQMALTVKFTGVKEVKNLSDHRIVQGKMVFHP